MSPRARRATADLFEVFAMGIVLCAIAAVFIGEIVLLAHLIADWAVLPIMLVEIVAIAWVILWRTD